MKFKSVEKALETDLFSAVKFQIMFYCFEKDINLSRTELDCLTLLGCRGRMRLTEFNELAAEMKILGSAPAVNNCLARIEKSKLFLKEGAGKKFIYLNPAMGVETKGNLFLVFKLGCVDESSSSLEGSNKQNSLEAQSV